MLIRELEPSRHARLGAEGRKAITLLQRRGLLAGLAVTELRSPAAG